MAWIEGKQEIRRRELPEKEWERQFALEGFLEEDVAKIELYKYFRENLSVAASLLMGVNLFPHQHIMLRTNFEADYVLNIIARAGGKSWIAAVFVGLYALMNPGVKIGIISSVFRQCLTGDAMVLTDKGLKPLRDIEVGDIVVSKNGKNSVKSKWKNEKSDGLELISKNGYSITGKKEHRCLVLDEENYELVYKELREISKGDFVVISESFEKYKRMTSKRYFPSPRKFVERKYGTRWGAKVFSRKSGITAKEIRSVLSKNLLIEKGDKEKILSLLDEGVIFDKVKDIRKVEDIETYDIEVENEHCYVANGFINHNSKQIFKYLEEIADKKGAELFKSCISKVEHKNDEYSIRIGDSVIYALPLGDGQKLRGFRFNLIVIDELLLMPKKVVNEVILPFLGAVQNPDKRRALRLAEDKLVERGLMKEEDRYVWPSNKLIGLSSASYKFDYLYELYQVYEALIMGEAINKNDESLKDIARKNSRRAIVHMSYEAIPEDVYDQDLLAQSKATFSEAGFAREFKAEFTDDSSGFFRISKMNLCTVDDGMEPSVEVKGDPNAKYLLAIDPSWAENEESDHFAMQLLKLNEEKEIATVVHSYAIAGGKVKDHARYLLYLLQNFNIVMIWADYAGGLQFINTCNESALFTDEKIKLTIMEEAFDPDEHYLESLRKGKAEYNEKSGYRVVLRKFSSDWIRKANELLQAHFDHRKIWFGARCMDDTYTKQTKQSIPINDIKFIEEDSYEEKGSSKMIDFVERQSECISLTKTECALIQVKTSPQGTQVFDLPDNLKRNKGKNRTRRDSYTALVIGNWGAKVYFDMIKAEEVQEMTDFEPIFIG